MIMDFKSLTTRNTKRFIAVWSDYKDYLVWIGIGLIVLVVSLIAIAYSVPFHSDMVVVQEVVHSIREHGLGQVWLSPDTFILKMPFYWLIDVLGFGGKASIVITAIIFNLFGFGIFGLFFAWLSRTYKIKPLVFGIFFIFLCALSLPIGQHLLNPNFRNGEYGGIFAVILALIAIYRFRLSRLSILLLSGFIVVFGGLLSCSDPLFLYTFFVPSLVFFAIRLLLVKADRRSILIVSNLSLSILFGLAIGRVFSQFFHFHIVGNNAVASFIPASLLVDNIVKVLAGSLEVFDGLFFGKIALKAETVRVLLNSVFFAVSIGLLAQALRRLRRSDAKTQQAAVWINYLSWLVVASPAVYILSQTGDVVNYRYLVSIYFFLPIIAAYGLSQLSDRRVKNVLLCAVCILSVINFGRTMQLALKARQDKSQTNAGYFQLIKDIEGYGASKGYAPYWDAGINTYLSDNKVLAISSLCLDRQVRPYQWWINDRDRTIAATKSFILLKLDETTCSEGDILTQFGEPQVRRVYEGSKVLYVYPYDVTDKLAAPIQPEASSS